jgi:hypothetical protein
VSSFLLNKLAHETLPIHEVQQRLTKSEIMMVVEIKINNVKLMLRFFPGEDTAAAVSG